MPEGIISTLVIYDMLHSPPLQLTPAVVITIMFVHAQASTRRRVHCECPAPAICPPQSAHTIFTPSFDFHIFACLQVYGCTYIHGAKEDYTCTTSIFACSEHLQIRVCDNCRHVRQRADAQTYVATRLLYLSHTASVIS